jgi:ESS family glutamate:Na+ symporter
VSVEILGLSLLLAGVFLVLAKLLRLRWRLAQKLFIPSSIIGGGLALLLGPEVLGLLAERAGQDGLTEGGIFGEEVFEAWSDLPGLLISVVFATLFLGRRIPRPRDAARLAGPQLSLGMTMASGQYVLGMLLALVVLTPVFGIDPMAGALIEIGFEGGHGTAAGLGDTFAELGFEEGGDLALGLATIGVVSGVVIGIGLINWAVRTGRTELLEEDAQASLAEQQGLFEKEDRKPGSIMTVRPSSIEPLAIHFGLVAVAILLGQLLLSGLQRLEEALWIDTIELFAFVPLFPLAMLGGVVVQLLIDRFDTEGIVDRGSMVRLQGLALDLLIVTALATLSLQVIADNLGPFVLLALTGVLWNLAAFLLFAQRMIPEFWFERGIGDLGQSMGVTATGLILMRVADPDSRTPAYESFGYKQLGFEPFFGGGLITAASIPLIAQLGPVTFLGIMAVVLALSLGAGLGYYGRKDPDPEILAYAERSGDEDE